MQTNLRKTNGPNNRFSQIFSKIYNFLNYMYQFVRELFQIFKKHCIAEALAS